MNKVGIGELSFNDAIRESLARYKELFKEVLNNLDKISQRLGKV